MTTRNSQAAPVIVAVDSTVEQMDQWVVRQGDNYQIEPSESRPAGAIAGPYKTSRGALQALRARLRNLRDNEVAAESSTVDSRDQHDAHLAQLVLAEKPAAKKSIAPAMAAAKEQNKARRQAPKAGAAAVLEQAAQAFQAEAPAVAAPTAPAAVTPEVRQALGAAVGTIKLTNETAQALEAARTAVVDASIALEQAAVRFKKSRGAGREAALVALQQARDAHMQAIERRHAAQQAHAGMVNVSLKVQAKAVETAKAAEVDAQARQAGRDDVAALYAAAPQQQALAAARAQLGAARVKADEALQAWKQTVESTRGDVKKAGARKAAKAALEAANAELLAAVRTLNVEEQKTAAPDVPAVLTLLPGLDPAAPLKSTLDLMTEPAREEFEAKKAQAENTAPRPAAPVVALPSYDVIATRGRGRELRHVARFGTEAEAQAEQARLKEAQKGKGWLFAIGINVAQQGPALVPLHEKAAAAPKAPKAAPAAKAESQAKFRQAYEAQAREAAALVAAAELALAKTKGKKAQAELRNELAMERSKLEGAQARLAALDAPRAPKAAAAPAGDTLTATGLMIDLGLSPTRVMPHGLYTAFTKALKAGELAVKAVQSGERGRLVVERAAVQALSAAQRKAMFEQFAAKMAK